MCFSFFTIEFGLSEVTNHAQKITVVTIETDNSFQALDGTFEAEVPNHSQNVTGRVTPQNVHPTRYPCPFSQYMANRPGKLGIIV